MGARGVARKAEASGQITAALGGLFAIAENYPELKANKNFMQLQTRISHLEESLADRREFYNDSPTTTISGSSRSRTCSLPAY